MNKYCYKIITAAEDLVPEKLKDSIGKIYTKNKFGDNAFKKDEKLPFIVIYSKTDGEVCVQMTSRAKKNVERVENIHQKLKAADLRIADTVLEKPYLFQLEQCSWWDETCELNQAHKWKTLVHKGPYFTHLQEPYEAHGAPLIYDGKRYKLTPAEERIANFYARRIISEKAGTITTFMTKDKVFNKNFWTDFKKYLTPEHKKIFKDFSKVKFTAIVKKLEQMKEADKELSAKEKQAKKVKTAERKQNYGYAIINGVREPVGNFTIEPAAIFYGRGDNPNRGKIKRDIDPEEVIINIGRDEAVPRPPAGHRWQEVRNDRTAAWIASWHDPITGQAKYVYLGAEGQLKGKSDYIKYEKARKLNKFIEQVRAGYQKDMRAQNLKKRQLGTVLYLIDEHGLRVGNEKSEDETDTVGASTIRVEHVKMEPPDGVVFDFLGKDSIRYYKKLDVPANVYKNFEAFVKGKKGSAALFDRISAADINAYLKSFDKDFTAKVFRTRLGSTVMDAGLKKTKVKKTATQDDKKRLFDKANLEVAQVLNHRRTVPPKAQETIKKYRKELRELKAALRDAKESGATAKKIESFKNRIKKKQYQIDAKKDTLNIAMTTSRTNYIDPRIAVAWSKEHELSIPKIYTATLQRKFKWAIESTPEDWDYNKTPLMPGMRKLQPAAAPSKKPSRPRAPAKKVRRREPVKKPVIPKEPTPEEPTLEQPPAWRGMTQKQLQEAYRKTKASKATVEKRKPKPAKPVPPKKLVSKDLVDFYLDKKPSVNGYWLRDILKWDVYKLEKKHDFIQTLFPLYTPGVARAPLLDAKTVEIFKTNETVRNNVMKAYALMTGFYGYQLQDNSSLERVQPIKQTIKSTEVIFGLYESHNFNRITRMLKFLMEIDMESAAQQLFLALCTDIRADPIFRKMVTRSKEPALKYWMKAIGMETDNYDFVKMKSIK